MDIKGYKIEHEIGHGGMATVYLAIQETLERRVALKVMNPQFAADPEFKNRFLREGPIAARLNDPQIVTIYDTGVEGYHYYLAMEYLPSGTLKDKIKQGLSIDQALAIAEQLGKALAYAHSRKVLHRDLKPQNILFRENGTPVLTDFGIAKAVGSSDMTMPGLAIGSPLYMSPEQAYGGTVDARSDLYSLGVVLHEMLAGKPPYQDAEKTALAIKHANDPLPHLPSKLHAFQPVLDKLLAKHADDRFMIAEQFVEALNQAIHQYRGTPLESASSPEGLTKVIPPADITPVPADTNQHGLSGVTENPNSGSGTQAAPPESPHSWWPWIIATMTAALTAVLIGYFVLTPQDVGIYIAKAEQLRYQGNYQGSISILQEGLQDHPGNSDINRKLQEIEAEQQCHLKAQRFYASAETLLNQNKPDAALREIEAGLELVSDHSDLLTLRRQAHAAIKEREQQQQINELVTLAERQFDSQKFLEPAGDNAYETYRRIQLSYDENNILAKQGLQRIAGYFLQQAQERFDKEEDNHTAALQLIENGLKADAQHAQLLNLKQTIMRTQEQHEQAQTALAKAQEQFKQGHFEQSLNTIAKGLKAIPDDSQLLALQQEIQQQQEQVQRLEKAQDAEQRARQYLAQNLFEESLETIAEGLEYQSDYEPLQILQQEVQIALERNNRQQQAEHHLATAKSLQKQGALAESLAQIRQGLALTPDLPELLDLKTDIEQALAKQKQIINLFARAERQMNNRQLTTPKGNNAYETLQEVLALEPQNEQAQDSLDKLATAYVALAQREFDSGQLPQSLEFIERGLLIEPEQKDLLILQALTLAQQWSEQGDLEQSLREIDNGLVIAPDHLKLTERRDQLRQELQTIATQRMAESLYQQAQKKYEQGDLGAAESLVEQGLQNQAEHAQLLALRDVVQRDLNAQNNYAQALSLFQQNRLKEALQVANAALETVPENNELLNLRNVLKSALDNIAARDSNPPDTMTENSTTPPYGATGDVGEITRSPATQEDIEQQLAAAEQQLADKKLTSPQGDNALETYRQILEYDPENNAAQEGIATIAIPIYNGQPVTEEEGG